MFVQSFVQDLCSWAATGGELASVNVVWCELKATRRYWIGSVPLQRDVSKAGIVVVAIHVGA
jgi:hypothetical protein